MFRPKLLVIFRDLSLACAAYDSTYRSEIPDMIKITSVVIKCINK